VVLQKGNLDMKLNKLFWFWYFCLSFRNCVLSRQQKDSLYKLGSKRVVLQWWP